MFHQPIDRRTLLALLAGAAAGGCGLGDYEERMQEQQDRLTRYEEEDRTLGVGVYLVYAEGDTRMFLRLPQGISSSGQDERVGEVLYSTFPRGTGAPSTNPFLGVIAVLLAETNDKDQVEKRRNEFWGRVKEKYGFKADQKGETIRVHPPGRGTLEYESFLGAATTATISVNLGVDNLEGIAVVFLLNGEPKAETQSLMKLVLGSVGVDSTAGRLHKEYGRRKKSLSSKGSQKSGADE